MVLFRNMYRAAVEGKRNNQIGSHRRHTCLPLFIENYYHSSLLSVQHLTSFVKPITL